MIYYPIILCVQFEKSLFKLLISFVNFPYFNAKKFHFSLQNVDTMWNTRVFGSRDHSVQGAQQSSRLVGIRYGERVFTHATETLI